MGKESKNYKLKLTVMGPVYIGSGKEIGKKEYLYIPRTNKVYIPDQYRLFAGLKKWKLLKEYEQLMMGGNNQKLFSLYDLLWNKRVPPAEYEQWAEYSLNLDDLNLGKNSLKAISAFEKDPYGYPYVPGSSLKGAIRTAVIGYLTNRNREKLTQVASEIETEQCYNRTNYLKRPIKKIEACILYSLKRNEDKKDDILNDCFTGLRVSDSRPVDVSCLTLCQKVDLLPDGTENPLNIMRECLRPGTEIEFEIKLDADFPYSMESILGCMKEQYQRYQNSFLKVFPNVGNIDGGGKDVYLYLGGGCGFHTKTVISALYSGSKMIQVTSKIINATLSGKPRQEHKHNLDLTKYRISPHTRKCTRYRNKLVDMGLCRITVEPMV